jgi:hypothetical protein
VQQVNDVAISDLHPLILPVVWRSSAACCRLTPRLSKDDLENKLQALPAWQLNEPKTTLTRTFTAKNFVAGKNPELAASSTTSALCSQD